MYWRACNPNVCCGQKEIAKPVVTALSKLKRSNMDSSLKQMDARGREVILQYVFYGFQNMPAKSTEFLNWHQAITKMDGTANDS